MKRVLFSIMVLVFFATLNDCYAQQRKMKLEDIKSIEVYCCFDSTGYTRGRVYTKFQELEANNTPKILLDSAFVDSLKNVLITTAKKQRLLGRWGINHIYARFTLNNNSTRNIIIARKGIYDYFIGGRGYFFIDNSKKQDMTMWLNNYYYKIVNKINATQKTD